jgi:hypothetical protein
MKLIRQKYNYHVSLDTVKELEDVILLDNKVRYLYEIHKKISKTLLYAISFVAKRNKKTKTEIVDDLKEEKSIKNIFAVLMGPDFSKCLPYFLFSGNKSLYIFDAWPKNHQIIINFLNFFKVKNVFFTSSQATEIIQSKVPNTACFWVPEGIFSASYKSLEYKDKTIDVLALGRRFNKYHKQIVGCLKENDKRYLYEKKKGAIIFPSRAGFIEGLAKSKISICVPSSITHPERSGDIETITQRYLQSMLSKCIILGHAPKEMIALFGYNPVIEIDAEHPENQIISILNNYDDYHALVEKNYEMVLKHHTWENRWELIKKVVNTN